MLNEVALTAISHQKSSLKLLHIEHRVHGYISDAGTVMNVFESLRYRMFNHLCFNGNSSQRKRTPYIVFPCRIKWLTLQYRVEKAALISCILNIEFMATFGCR